MRTLIFGAKGQLGKDLLERFRRDHDVRGFDLDEVDITAPAAVRATTRAFRPELVINAAAYTDVEGAEDDAENAFRVNEAGARHLAAVASALHAPIVYFSTDYVFGGAKSTPYEPDDPIDPIGIYARSKAAGEQATREANPRHFIIRTAWLYGPGGNNFVEKILALARTRPSLRIVEDEVGSPTHTADLADATFALAKTSAYGSYHAVNAGACSRFEFARAILRGAGLATEVEPCPSAEFPTKAERPLYSVLSNAALESAANHVMPPWQSALKHYLQRRKPQE